MKVISLLVLASTASAFVPGSAPIRTCVSLDAKHVNNKAAKKANHDRPRKSRPSDINRKPTNYPQWNDAEDGPMPTEYTISGN